jgi:hypothetical protein
MDSKYDTMRKVGVPEEAVQQSMTVDATPKQVSESKYDAMRKVGVPEEAVQQSMTVDATPRTVQNSTQ